MKRIILSFFTVFIYLALFSQEEISIIPDTEKITVYPNSAEINSSSEINLKNDYQTIIFDSLPSGINQKTIQTKAEGDLIILDVKYRLKQSNPLNPQEKSIPPRIRKEISSLEDSIRIKSYVINNYQNQIDVLKTEKNILLNNSLIRGNGGDTIPELKQTLEFFRKKLNEINSEIIRTEKEFYPHKTEYEKMNERLSELKAYNNRNLTNKTEKAVPQILVHLKGKSNSKGKIDLSYLVNNAGWNISYDIRANDKEDINIIYKAKIYQSTGKDWKKSRLTLSTSNPLQQFNKPKLPIWYVSYNNRQSGTSGNLSTNDSEVSTRDYRKKEASQPNTEAAYDYTRTINSMLNVEYKIDLDYKIPSDGQYHTVAFKTSKPESDFAYYAAPKISRDVYLTAKITDWEGSELIPGSANIYFNGRYTGQTQINSNTTDDTLELTLGKTRGIQIERELKNKSEKPQLVGNWVTNTYNYKIRVKNSKSNSVMLTIEDNIPHSTNREIEIDIIDKGGAEFNEETSHLKWEVSIKPGNSKDIYYSYKIKHNKSLNINL